MKSSRRNLIQASLALGAALSPAPTQAQNATCGRSSLTEEGPFYPVSDIPGRADLTGASRPAGQLLYVVGAVRDARCAPLANATIILWQADNNGRYDHPNAQNNGPLDPNFRYFGRLNTGADGSYRIKTILPAPYQFQGLNRASHIHFSFGEPRRGLVTELYFDRPEDTERRAGDRVWGFRDRATRDTMIGALKTGAPPIGGAIESDALWCRYDVTMPT